MEGATLVCLAIDHDTATVRVRDSLYYSKSQSAAFNHFRLT